MDSTSIKKLLQNLKDGDMTIEHVLERLKHLPFEDIGCATIDHHRGLRQGFPEVILGEGKTVGQIGQIVAAMCEKGSNILVTRLDEDRADMLQAAAFPPPDTTPMPAALPSSKP